MPGIRGKSGGRRNESAAANGRKVGRPPKAEKVLISGKIRVRIDPATEMVIPVDADTRMLAVRLMLRDWPGVTSVEQLFAYAIRKLAETTND